ncbi:molybdate transport system substrate-binding protein [Roseateles sp. YR242]|uniref:substrate-binding domain-containing protein n=1 Tax=Roseateles sp. YR242 TaxID=1855305 RepID=UPI0008C18E9E|nr:substrate-binding domain-containing protein [Roseateles sp. YR242]SEL65653.1 molybdate transport system substrate-binding protein [Roseateles sp. YR242]
MIAPLVGISSMATRQVLADLASALTSATGLELRVESVGGVDAAKRVAAGEVLDLVILAEDAMSRLADAGHLVADSRRVIVESPMVIAATAGGPLPDVSTGDALRQALLDAPGIGYSTGPSGTALLQLIDRWGLRDALGERLRQAPPGVPVGSFIAKGDVSIGFQQLSELQHVPGITILGPMPAGFEIITRFVGAVAATSAEPATARRALDFLTEARHDALKQRHGMTPPA